MENQIVCSICGVLLDRRKSWQTDQKRKHDGSVWSGKQFCSRNCFAEFRNQKVSLRCCWCNESIVKEKKELKKSKSGKVFCNRSCSASYNNTQKRKSRRSKMEIKLFELIKKDFPNLEVLHNDKEMLFGYEVDIAIPAINLAIEWNGIVHYQPIYGQSKLDSIQMRDYEKEKQARDKGINLLVIPDLVSNDKYLNEAYMKIKKIIEDNL